MRTNWDRCSDLALALHRLMLHPSRRHGSRILTCVVSPSQPIKVRMPKLTYHGFQYSNWSEEWLCVQVGGW